MRRNRARAQRGPCAPAPVACRRRAAVLPQVTYQDLLDGLKHPSRWLTYSGDYTGRRHSPLKQITPDNVSRLAAQWTFQAEGMATGRGFEGTPLVMDGVLYITGNNNTAWAIDARTGRQLWRYRRQLPSGLTYGARQRVEPRLRRARRPAVHGARSTRTCWPSTATPARSSGMW